MFVKCVPSMDCKFKAKIMTNISQEKYQFILFAAKSDKYQGLC